jgi:hypothetical protein
LDRAIHEGDDYETENDYRKKDKQWVSSLLEVRRVLEKNGYSMEDLRDTREINAP